jgi:hypothetical protein
MAEKNLPKGKLAPAPIDTTIGGDPDNAEKLEKIKAIAVQQEQEAKKLGPNWVPANPAEKSSDVIDTAPETKTIAYTPSDLARKYSMGTKMAASTGSIGKNAYARSRQAAGFREIFGKTSPILASDLSTRELRTAGTYFEGTPSQKTNRDQLEELKAKDAAEDLLNMQVGVAKQLHRASFPGVPWPGMTAHRQMMSERQAKIDADNKAYEELRPKVTIPPTSTKASGEGAIFSAPPQTPNVTKPRYIPSNTIDYSNVTYTDITNHPLYKHTRTLYDTYGPNKNKEAWFQPSDSEKTNWVRNHLKTKVLPALYPDNEKAAYDETMKDPDKILDLFETYHTRQKAYESAFKKGVLPGIEETDKDGNVFRRKARTVHTINAEIQRLKNSNLDKRYVELDDPEDVERDKKEQTQAIQDSSDVSGFSEQYNPESVAQSSEEAKMSKIKEAGDEAIKLPE